LRQCRTGVPDWLAAPDLAAAAANGRKGRRPRKVGDADAAKARQLRDKGITATDIAKMLGVSRATVTATFPMVRRSPRDSWCRPTPGPSPPAVACTVHPPGVCC